MRKPIKFDTLEQIKAHQWVGNAHDDGPAILGVENFARDKSHSVADRAEALRDMQDRGMGCGRADELSDEDLVNPLCPMCGNITHEIRPGVLQCKTCHRTTNGTDLE